MELIATIEGYSQQKFEGEISSESKVRAVLVELRRRKSADFSWFQLKQLFQLDQMVIFSQFLDIFADFEHSFRVLVEKITKHM